MTHQRSSKMVSVACVLALVALGLMSWSVLDPRPVPVIVAMSVGQVIGTLSLLLYLTVVFYTFRGGPRRAPRPVAPSARDD